MYAEVAVNLPVQSTFHYHIPPQLAGKVQPGNLVRVSFGTAEEPGIVLALTQSSPVEQTKPVKALIDSRPVVGPVQMQVARWLSENTLAPLGYCLWLFLPPGIAGRSDVFIELTEAGKWLVAHSPEAVAELADNAQVLLRLLGRRGGLYGRQLNQAMRGKNWREAVAVLAQHELARQATLLRPPTVQPRKVRTARLAIPAEQVDVIAPRLGRENKQADVLEVLLASPDDHPTAADICLAAGCTMAALQQLAKSGDISLTPKSRWLELTAPDAQVQAQIGAGEFDRAIKQKEVLSALVAAGGALPAGDVPSGVAASLRQKELVVSGEQPATVALAKRYVVPDGPLTAGQPDHTALVERLVELRGGEKSRRVLRLLAREAGAVQVNWIYAQTDSDLKLLRDLADEGLVILGEAQQWRDPLAGMDYEPTAAPVFTSDQHAAWERLRQHMDSLKWEGVSPTPDDPHVFLLHGVTGSGKTEVYLRAVEHTLAHGRGAIVLVPEIALTPQTVGRFAARFPGQVAIVHGNLSPGERFDTWQRVRSGEVNVVVGTRSALFAPLADLGLVILDEEHDPSYKQSPPLPPPYYHARETAIELTRRSRGIVILGSATPSLESYHAAQQGVYQHVVLPVRVAGHQRRVLEMMGETQGRALYHPGDPKNTLTVALPQVDVVDMRVELKAGNTSMFSRPLREALTGVLGRGEQAILFLNRRGTASYVFCRDCGYKAECPRCNMPLAYHQVYDGLRCHHCGYRRGTLHVCPECNSRRIRHFGAGTEQVQAALGDVFPGVRSIRWDRDTASHHRDHDAILSRFAAHDADVLIGTQMIAKGLDLPGVTLVGVLNADVGLALPDFRAQERTFQLLMQVVGRAGRAGQPGKGIIQTYDPAEPAIQAAAAHDYVAFYERAIISRRELGYPPFRRLARLLIRNHSGPQAQREAERAAQLLRRRIQEAELDGTSVIGPAPCFFAKLEGHYRWQIIVRSPDPVAAFQTIDRVKGWYLDIDPADLL